MDGEEEDWYGAVEQSALDNRCWFAVLPGTDIMASEGHCSSSIRKVKAYVLKMGASGSGVDPSTLKWVASDDGKHHTLVDR